MRGNIRAFIVHLAFCRDFSFASLFAFKFTFAVDQNPVKSQIHENPMQQQLCMKLSSG